MDASDHIVGNFVHVGRPVVLDLNPLVRVAEVDAGRVDALAVVAVGGEGVAEDELDLDVENVDGARRLGQALVEDTTNGAGRSSF